MNSLIFATNNNNKVAEIRAVLKGRYNVLPLKEAGIDIDIPEPHLTLEENAREKATTIYQLTNSDCFSEDSGLLVDALDGDPGVKSARYAGENADFKANIELLLNNMRLINNREAKFKTVIYLILKDKSYSFEGECAGKIIREEKGDHGFGYDPVFIPDGSSKTFAEMTMEEKNIYSHRRKAVDKLIQFLNSRDEEN